MARHLRGVDSGGSNWSDLGVHLSIAQSLNAGNFPPQVPYFAGAPLVYHWFADFHDAIVANAAGLFAIPVFVTSSAILAGSLVLCVHGLGRTLLRGRGARRAALIAATIAVFAGGFGWIRLVGDVANGLGDPLTLITTHGYDNTWFDVLGQVTWPYFRIPSVMGTGLLVHRATMAGLPMLVAMVLLLVAGLPTAKRRRAGWRDRPMLIALAGLTGALLAPFHFFFFPAGLLIALLWVVTAGRLTDAATPRNALLFGAPYLLSLPFAVAPLLQATGSGALKLVAGWESAPFADGPAAVVFFYVTNLGVPFVLAAVALVWRRTPARWFFAGWAVLLFVVPNVIQVSVIAFDMNKYFQAMWIAVALLAGWLLRRWPWPAVAVVLALSVPSPLLVGAWTALNREQVLSSDQLAAAEWIAANTPDGAVFATDGWLNSPTDPAGRLRLLTFQPYVANLGYSPDVRASEVTAIYCGGDPAADRQPDADAQRDLPHRRRATIAVPGARGLQHGARHAACVRQPDAHHLPAGQPGCGDSPRIIGAMSSTTATGAVVALDHVMKRYGGSEAPPAVTDLSLTVAAGEVCVLVGPSGCGKTTTMKMINRLVDPTSGTITIDGEDIMGLPAVELRRRIGYVIQQVGLFPHMTIGENAGVVPRLLRWPDARVRDRVEELLDLVGLDPESYRDRYPSELSGGERQRVGVARALAADPPVMLMDEPFGAVDPIRRERLQNEFLRLQAKVRKTIVFVTHDVDEAIKMADRIAILQRGGVLAQYDTPNTILAQPASEFVERFVGADRGLKRLSLARVRDLPLLGAVIVHAGDRTRDAERAVDVRTDRLRADGGRPRPADRLDSRQRARPRRSHRSFPRDARGEPARARDDAARRALGHARLVGPAGRGGGRARTGARPGERRPDQRRAPERNAAKGELSRCRPASRSSAPTGSSTTWTSSGSGCCSTWE